MRYLKQQANNSFYAFGSMVGVALAVVAALLAAVGQPVVGFFVGKD